MEEEQDQESIQKQATKGLVSGIIGGATFLIGITGGLNLYQHHNNTYETKREQILEKVDGISTHTRLTINKEDRSIEVMRKGGMVSDLWGTFYTSLKDNDRDGKVDMIYEGFGLFTRGPSNRFLYRNEDLEQNIQTFEQADKEFNKQLERFKKEYLIEKN